MSYLILSPGRCGSVFLTSYLSQNLNKIILHVDEYDFLSNLNPTDNILHVHKIDIARQFPNFKILLVRRSPVEIAASILIAQSTNVFHFNKGKDDTKNPVTKEAYIDRYKDEIFEIDRFEFLKLVQTYINWYISAKDLLEDSIIFEYEEAIDISTINLKLNLDIVDTDSMILPIAQPWDKWDRIRDGHSIRAAGNKLFSYYTERYKDIFPIGSLL